nr:hypothetical protein [Prolixibacteraceae bacterium]
WLIRTRGREWFTERFLPRLKPFSISALLVTLVLLFAFQGEQILTHPLHILLIAIPLTLQTYLIFFITWFGGKKLGLPYRIIRLCGGDMSFASAMTYDFEVFSAAQERWLEVSSVSNFETFQSSRLKCRFKGKDSKKPELVHTLNGSALALPRIVAALLENNQTSEGIRIPEVLIPFCGFEKIM